VARVRQDRAAWQEVEAPEGEPWCLLRTALPGVAPPSPVHPLSAVSTPDPSRAGR